jgi:hypothetical protein
VDNFKMCKAAPSSAGHEVDISMPADLEKLEEGVREDKKRPITVQKSPRAV